MNVKDYQHIIKETAIYPKNIGLAYCALGLTGEAGEVAEKVKKIYRDGNEVDSRAIAKELGDVLWYITALGNEIGVSLETIMDMNYRKLINRRATGTLKGDGDDREEIANELDVDYIVIKGED